MTDMLFIILFLWNMVGFVIYIGIELAATMSTEPYTILNPCDVYKIWAVNYFGCGLLTLIFNLLCPIMSIMYWLWKLIHFICTVGRR